MAPKVQCRLSRMLMSRERMSKVLVNAVVAWFHAFVAYIAANLCQLPENATQIRWLCPTTLLEV